MTIMVGDQKFQMKKIVKNIIEKCMPFVNIGEIHKQM